MRIAIVNDMQMAVEAMRRVLMRAHGCQLAWVARDGMEAVAACARDKPDLVLMDLIMPEMDGVEATRRIMARTPCAIVVVTANVDRNTAKVFEAMGAGALDAVNTPILGANGHPGGAQALLAKINTIARLLAPPGSRRRPLLHWNPSHASRPQEDQLVAIGASAGGPTALAKVLSALPKDFPGAIVVVQHVDADFAPGLARWLGHQTPLHVRLAEEGDRPQRGTVLLAGRDSHLVFSSPTCLSYSRAPFESHYRPSIDVFFKSILQHWRGDAVGVLLTGMGRDGAEGLKALRENGCHTIAQDEATSVAYGMPKAAADLQAVTRILPLSRIGPHLVKLLQYQIYAHA